MNTAANPKGTPDLQRPAGALKPVALDLERASISWRAIFAGTLIAILIFAALLSLGLAVGSASVQGLIQGGGNASGLGIGATIWLVVSILISLFAGAYLAARGAGLIPRTVGRIQGLVITALFFGFVLMQAGAALSLLGRGVGAAGTAASEVVQTPGFQNLVNEQLKGLNLKSAPQTVAKGITSRLMRGDTEAAKNYLANQAGISPAEADKKIKAISQNVQQAAASVGVAATNVTQAAGWGLFVAIALGGLCALLGGGAGSIVTLRRNLEPAEGRSAAGR